MEPYIETTPSQAEALSYKRAKLPATKESTSSRDSTPPSSPTRSSTMPSRTGNTMFSAQAERMGMTPYKNMKEAANSSNTRTRLIARKWLMENRRTQEGHSDCRFNHINVNMTDNKTDSKQEEKELKVLLTKMSELHLLDTPYKDEINLLIKQYEETRTKYGAQPDYKQCLIQEYMSVIAEKSEDCTIFEAMTKLLDHSFYGTDLPDIHFSDVRQAYRQNGNSMTPVKLQSFLAQLFTPEAFYWLVISITLLNKTKIPF